MAYPENTVNTIDSSSNITSGLNRMAGGMYGHKTASLPSMSDSYRAGLNRMASSTFGGRTRMNAEEEEEQKRKAAEQKNNAYGPALGDEALSMSPDEALFSEFQNTIAPYVQMDAEEMDYYYKQSGLIAKNGGDANSWAQEFLTVNAIANASGLSRGDVYKYKDDLLEYYTGNRGAQMTFTVGGAIINSIKQGQRQQDSMQLKDDLRDLYRMGADDSSKKVQETLKKIEELDQEMAYNQDYTPHGLVMNLADNALSQLAYMWNGTKAGMGGEAIGTAAALGIAFAMPGAAAFVAPLVTAGRVLGGSLARLNTYYGGFAGDAFYNMKKAGVSTETALKYSNIDGIANAINEALLDETFSLTSAGIAKISGMDLGKTFYPSVLKTLGGNGSFSRYAGQLLWYMGTDALGEFFQEATQSLQSAGALALAEKADNLKYSSTVKEALSDAWQEGVQGFTVGLMFGIVPGLINVKADASRTAPLKENVAITSSREAFTKNPVNRQLVEDMALLGEHMSEEDISEALGNFWDNVQNARVEIAKVAAKNSSASSDTGESTKPVRGQKTVNRGPDGRVRTEGYGYRQTGEGQTYKVAMGSSVDDAGNGKATRYGDMTVTVSKDGKTATISDVHIENGYEGSAAELVRTAIENYVQGYENVVMNDESPLAKEIADQLTSQNPNGEASGLKYTKGDQASQEKSAVIDELQSMKGIYSGNVAEVKTTEAGPDGNVVEGTRPAFITREEATLVANMLENLAKAKGLTLFQYRDKYYGGRFTIDPTDSTDTRISGVNGSYSGFSSTDMVGPDGILTNLRGLIHVAAVGDFSTFQHEAFHLNLRIDPEAREDLASRIKENIEDKSKGGKYDKLEEYVDSHMEPFRRNGFKDSKSVMKELSKIKTGDDLVNSKLVKSEEALDSLYEAWLADDNKRTANLPDALKEMFKAIAKAMQNIYRSLKGQNIQIDEGIENSFIKAMNFLGSVNQFEEGRDSSSVGDSNADSGIRKQGSVTDQTEHVYSSEEEASKDFVNRLRNAFSKISNTIESDGEANFDSIQGAREATADIRKSYDNKDTGERYSFGGRAIKELFRHDYKDPVHLASIMSVPRFIEEGKHVISFIDSEGRHFDYYISLFRHKGETYFVRSYMMHRNSQFYYGHQLTPYEQIKDLFNSDTPKESQGIGAIDPSYFHDRRLLEFLQGKNPAQVIDGSRKQLSEGIESESQRQYDEVRAKYYGTDQWLKAPNGKDTNLTERQWVQVRTPNFMKWSRNWESVVKDDNGEPLVMYHGTPFGTFDRFDRSRIGSNTGVGRGSFSFTSGKDAAGEYADSISSGYASFTSKVSALNEALSRYADDSFYDAIGYDQEGPMELDPEYFGEDFRYGLSEYDFDTEEEWEEYKGKVENEAREKDFNSSLKSYIDAARKTGNEALANALEYLNVGETGPNVYEVFIGNADRINTVGATSETYNEVAWNNQPKEGEVTVLELEDGSKVAFVYSPSSIKSAMDNNGDFNPDDERIRYQLAPEGYEPKKVGHGVKMFEMDLETGELFPLFLNKRYIMDNGVEREAIAFNEDGSVFDYDNATERDFPHHYEKGSYEKPIVQGKWLIADDNRQKGFSARPGWHLGANVPYGPWLVSTQGVYNAKRGNKSRRFARVWAEVSYTMDKDYQEELDRTGKKDIKNHIPEDGYYFFREANGSTWVITGAIKIDRIMTTREAYDKASQVVGDFEQGIVDYPNNHYNGTVDELRENWRKYLELSDEREGIISKLYPTESQKIERDYSVASDIADIASDIRRQGETGFSSEAQRQYDEVRAKYIGTEEWMKAPNGKKTKLTERQWIQVRTPNFIRWFGDWINDPANASKAVDENGEPKVFYHGTKSIFDIFSKSASSYHEKNPLFNQDKFDALVKEEREIKSKVNGDVSKLSKDDRTRLKELDNLRRTDEYRVWNYVPSGFFFADTKEVSGTYGENVVPVFLNLRSPDIKDVEGSSWKWVEDYGNGWNVTTKDYIEGVFEIRDRYDSVIFENIIDVGPRFEGDEYPLSTVAVAFYPNQIKSAIDNNGDFSLSDNHIRFQGAGDIESPNFKRWFGNSVAVGDDGKPLELIHGSFEGFDTFDQSSDIGYHFGTQEQAEEVLYNKANENPAYNDANPIFYKVYARIENPIVFSKDMASWTGDNRQFLSELRAGGYITNEEYAEMVRMADENDLYNSTGDASELNARLKQILMSKGYDGIVYPNHFEGVTFNQDGTRSYDRSYMVFTPNQVKSATDNNGNYSLVDNNIRHQGAGGFTVVTRNMTVAEQNGYKMTVHADGSMTVTGNIDNFRSDIQASNVSDAMKDKVKGQLVGKGRKLEIAPSTAKVARDLVSGGQFASRGGMVFSDYYKDSNGKVVGAPAKYDTPQKIAQGLRPLMVQLTKEGVMGRMWYEDSSNAILNATGNDTAMAERLADIYAILSPQMTVPGNTTLGINAWYQSLMAEIFPDRVVKVKTGSQNTNLLNLTRGIKWDGQKTNNFSINLRRAFGDVGAGDMGVTVDMWMMRAFGYDSDSPSDAQYFFVENEVNKLVQLLNEEDYDGGNWEPQQVQAAIWVALKARTEDETVKRETEEESQKKGYMHYVTNAKGKKERVLDNPAAHRMVWLKHAMEYDYSKLDHTNANYNFSTGMWANIGQVSWEAAPSFGSGVLHGYFDADEELKKQYLKDIASIFVDENGVDQLAKMVGLLYMGQVQAPGAWSDPATGEVSVSPGMQNIYSISAKDSPAYDWKGNPVLKANGEVKMTKSVTPEAVEALNLYSAILGYLLKQDGVGWNKLMPSLNASEDAGMHLRIGRPLTESEAEGLEKAIVSVVDEYNRMMEGEEVSGYKKGKKHPSNLFREEYEWMRSRAEEGKKKNLLSAGDIGLVSSKDGMMLVNFTKSNEIDGVEYSDGRYVYGLPNRLFRAIIESASTRFVEEYDLADIEGEFSKHESGLVGNDWEENKDGREYKVQASKTGRSDLFTAAVLQFGPQVRNTMASYSEKYGWGDIGTDPTSIITEEDRESLRKRMLSGRRLQGAPLDVSSSIESKLNSFVSETTPFGEGRSSLVEEVKRDAFRLSRDIAEEDFDTEESLARERGAVSGDFIALIEDADPSDTKGHEYAFEFPKDIGARYQGNEWGKVYSTDEDISAEQSPSEWVNVSDINIDLMTGSEAAKDKMFFLAMDDDQIARTIVDRFPELQNMEFEDARLLMKDQPRNWRQKVAEEFNREDMIPSGSELPEIELGSTGEIDVAQEISVRDRSNIANRIENDPELENAVRYGNGFDEVVGNRLEATDKSINELNRLMDQSDATMKKMTDAIESVRKEYEDALANSQKETDEANAESKDLGTRLKRTTTSRDKWRQKANEKKAELAKAEKELQKEKDKFSNYKSTLERRQKERKAALDAREYKMKLARSLTRKWSKSVDFRTVAPIMQEIRSKLDPKFARNWVYDPINNPNGDKGGETMAYEDAKKLVEDMEAGTIGNLAGVTKKEIRDRLGSKIYDQLSGEGAKPLNEWSVQDLESLNARLEQAWAEGRKVQEERLQKKRERRKGYIDAIVTQIMKSDKYKKNAGQKISGSVEEKSIGRWFRSVMYSVKRMQELVGILDGVDGTENRSLLVEQVRDANEEETRAIERRVSHVSQIIKAINEKLGNMAVESFFYQKTFGVDIGTGEKKFTGSALAYVFLSQFNEKAKQAVMYGNLVDTVEKGDRDADGNLIARERTIIDDEDLKSIAKARYEALLNFATKVLNDNGMMPVVNAIRSDLENPENSKALMDFSLDTWNQPIVLEEHYLPVRRMTLGGAQEISDPAQLNMVTGNYLESIRKGFLEEKQNIAPRHQKEVRLDLMGVWMDSVRQQEHLKSTGVLLSDINAVYENSSMVRDTIERAYGKEMLDEIADYTRFVADPNATDAKNDVTRTLRAFQGSTSLAYLSFKLSSVFTQLVASPAPFLGEARMTDLLKGYAMMSAHPLQSWAFVTSKSTMMATRSADLMIDAIKEAQKDPNNKAWQALAAKVQGYGMLPLEWVDKYCVAGGWLGVYNTRLEEYLTSGLSSEEADRKAVKDADEVVYRTQPTGTKTELSRLFRNGNALLKIFLQFQSAMNVVFNNVTGDMRLDWQKAKNGDKRAVQRIIGHTVGYMMAGVILGAVQEGFKEHDDDDEKKAAARKMFTILNWSLSQGVEAIPAFGDIASDVMSAVLTGEKGFQRTRDMFPFITDTFGGLGTIAAGLWKNDQEDKVKAFKSGGKKFVKGVSIGLGIPTSGIKQAVKAWDEKSFLPLLGRN